MSQSLIPASVIARQARPWRRPLGWRVAAFGVAIVTLALLVAPQVAPYDLDAQSSNAFAGPSGSHLLGTDEVGRDTLSRLMYAIRLDLVIALLAIPVGGCIGTLLGLSGVLSPRLGQLTARLFDIVIGFPTLVLAIAVALVMTPGTTAVIVAISVINVPVFGRLARGSMLTQLSRDYVVAARMLGASQWRILRRHILPNIRSALLVQGAIAIADAVFIEGALSILGLGIQAPRASLGSMVQSGLPYIAQSPVYVLAPTLALAVIILMFTTLADLFNRRESGH